MHGAEAGNTSGLSQAVMRACTRLYSSMLTLVCAWDGSLGGSLPTHDSRSARGRGPAVPTLKSEAQEAAQLAV